MLNYNLKTKNWTMFWSVSTPPQSGIKTKQSLLFFAWNIPPDGRKKIGLSFSSNPGLNGFPASSLCQTNLPPAYPSALISLFKLLTIVFPNDEDFPYLHLHSCHFSLWTGEGERKSPRNNLWGTVRGLSLTD